MEERAGEWIGREISSECKLAELEVREVGEEGNRYGRQTLRLL